MNRVFRKYLLSNLALMGFALGLVACINIVCDPFRQFSIFDLWDRHLDKVDSRTFKAAVLDEEEFDIVIMGDSVAEYGFDPQHPAWGGKKVFNAALPGANMYELNHVLDMIIEEGEAKKVFFSGSIGMWSNAHRVRHDFDKSRFNPELSVFEYYLEGAFGLRALDASCGVIEDVVHNQESLFLPDGRRRGAGGRANMGHRKMFDDRALLSVNSPSSNPCFVESRVEIFREMVRKAREANLELVYVFPPCHAYSLETLWLTGRYGSYEDLIRTVVQVMAEDAAAHPDKKPFEVWDFSGYSAQTTEAIPPGTESMMAYFWEQDHFKKELGDLVIGQVEGGAPGFGRRLTPENLESHLEELRKGHQQYEKNNSWEIAHLQSLRHEQSKN